MEVGGEGAQNTGVLKNDGTEDIGKSVKWLKMSADSSAWAQNL